MFEDEMDTRYVCKGDIIALKNMVNHLSAQTKSLIEIMSSEGDMRRNQVAAIEKQLDGLAERIDVLEEGEKSMKLVIDIDQETYERIVNMYGTFPAEWKRWGLEAIKNGTPLPKGFKTQKEKDEEYKIINSLWKRQQ